MKLTYLFILTLFLGIPFIRCKKTGIAPNKPENALIHFCNNKKTTSNFLMFIQTGHDESKCPGCVLQNGKSVHVNCMGYGNNCSVAFAVQLYQLGSTVTAITTDSFDLTSDDHFLIPDRSLSFTDEKGNDIFLNIPEQKIYRDSSTLQFTLSGLFFSDKAAYENN